MRRLLLASVSILLASISAAEAQPCRKSLAGEWHGYLTLSPPVDTGAFFPEPAFCRLHIRSDGSLNPKRTSTN
jgi:hypothetical protein